MPQEFAMSSLSHAKLSPDGWRGGYRSPQSSTFGQICSTLPLRGNITYQSPQNLAWKSSSDDKQGPALDVEAKPWRPNLLGQGWRTRLIYINFCSW